MPSLLRLPKINVPASKWLQTWQPSIGQISPFFHRFKHWFGGNRPALTLLCCVNGRFIRADLDDRGGLLGPFQRLPIECDAVTDLPQALAATVNEDHPFGKRLWLLHDSLPNQTVEVPGGQVAGIADEQLSQALLFELQELTGLVTTNLQAAPVLLSQLEGQNTYWLAHVPKTLIAQLRRVAKELGCEFAGLAHPAAVPHPLTPDTGDTPWARLEVWPDMLIGMDASTGGKRNLWALSGNAKPKRVQTDVERWRNALGAKVQWEALGDGMAVDFLPSNTRVVNLDNDDTLSLWLERWGQTLLHGAPGHCPALLPPEDPARENWIMAAGAAGALAVCLLHWGIQYYRMQSVEPDKIFLKRSESSLVGLETEIGRYKRQHDELIKKLEPGLRGRATATPEVLAALRKRMAALLRELALNASDAVVIEEIHTKPESIVVKGVSLEAAEANRLAQALETHLHGLGWRIEPPRKKDLGMDASGGPWQFEILLSDAGQAGFANPTPTQGTGGAHCGAGMASCRGQGGAGMAIKGGQHVE